MGQEQRQSERYRVALKVKYSTARDFVVDYAEDLSAGGLFVRGAHELEPGDRVTVQLVLPGFEAFQVAARVAHVIDVDEAARLKRRPGAGLRVVESPEGFQEALLSYLLRLGRRRDHLLLVDNEKFGARLEEAGYHVRKAPVPTGLAAAVEASDQKVLAVVVPRDKLGGYVKAALDIGAPELVRPLDFVEELDDLLGELDEELTPPA